MPQPTLHDVHVNAPLTNVSVAYIQDSEDFIADKVFPVVPVTKQSDVYYTYTKNDWFRDEAKKRAPGTESAGGGYGLSTATYSCDVFAWHKDIADQIRGNADAVLNLDVEATRYVTQKLLLRRENQSSADFLTTSVWGTDYTGVASGESGTQFRQWSDYANSDPVNDIKVGRLKIKITTGMKANTLVLGEETFESLKNHPDIVDRYKYTNSQVVSKDMLARLFEVDNIFISGGVEATNVEGETGVYAFINSKMAMLCHSSSAPSLMTPSAGYTFEWTGISGLGFSTAISTFRIPILKSDRVEGESAFDCKVIGSDLGVYFATAIA